MKISTLVDKHGNVLAMFHSKHNGPVVRFKAAPGEHALELDLPHDLQHLNPKELHDSVRVDLSGSSPRLVVR